LGSSAPQHGAEALVVPSVKLPHVADREVLVRRQDPRGARERLAEEVVEGAAAAAVEEEHAVGVLVRSA
jgi:hypothetical protein